MIHERVLRHTESWHEFGRSRYAAGCFLDNPYAYHSQDSTSAGYNADKVFFEMISRGTDPELPCENGYPWLFDEDDPDIVHCPPEWPAQGFQRPLVVPSGVDVCEYHGFDEQTCEQQGCCFWLRADECFECDYLKDACWSSTGRDPCSGEQSEFVEDDADSSRLGEERCDDWMKHHCAASCSASCSSTATMSTFVGSGDDLSQSRDQFRGEFYNTQYFKYRNYWKPGGIGYDAGEYVLSDFSPHGSRTRGGCTCKETTTVDVHQLVPPVDAYCDIDSQNLYAAWPSRSDSALVAMMKDINTQRFIDVNRDAQAPAPRSPVSYGSEEECGDEHDRNFVDDLSSIEVRGRDYYRCAVDPNEAGCMPSSKTEADCEDGVRHLSWSREECLTQFELSGPTDECPHWLDGQWWNNVAGISVEDLVSNAQMYFTGMFIAQVCCYFLAAKLSSECTDDLVESAWLQLYSSVVNLIFNLALLVCLGYVPAILRYYVELNFGSSNFDVRERKPDDPLSFAVLENWILAERAGYHSLTFSMWIGVFSWGFPIVSVQTCAHLVYDACVFICICPSTRSIFWHGINSKRVAALRWRTS
eukprot:COSAG02_NODE_6945_length_3271_cov_2.617907_2_plen_586_part_00